ncbi:MAG: hypothetical protein MUF60_01700 [Vicinamibacterales bacterium]|jgi:predicted Fe-Mo cluster-binding NifX family protein|nr:hypothetical protein [Vicinamibacterales bacterium]
MSRLALPAWEGRISPVFDVARRFLLVDLEGRHEVRREIVHLTGLEPSVRASRLATHHVDVLICGAISLQVERVLDAGGVTVVSGICGDVELVLDAYLAGRLDDEEDLHLPGWYPSPHLATPAGGPVGRGRWS